MLSATLQIVCMFPKATHAIALQVPVSMLCGICFHRLLLLLFSSMEFVSGVVYWTIGFAAAGKLSQSFEGLSCNNKKLKVFHSDPFDYHSIMDALKGCCGLFYSFEPPSDQPTYDVCQLLILLLKLYLSN